jgi:telomere length regulation protein
LPPDFGDALTDTPSTISATSALIVELLGTSDAMRAHLETWLSDPTLNASESFALRRAAVSAFAHASKGTANMLEDPVQDLMEKIMKRFGDNLFVKHSPILQQEACAQILLLLAGYAHRAQPMSLFIMARSSAHLNGMSNRLNSSSPRARFLGMVVGMAISDLVDKQGSKMNFEIDDLKTPEAKWYQHLVKVDDKIGSFKDIKEAFGARSLTETDSTTTSKARPAKNLAQPKLTPKPLIQEEVQGPRIMEVLDDSEEDDDLVPYAKPDFDPEDEDEDPTMINRDKPKAPVYIRDLMAGLNDSENYDKHSLALKSAAALIRRKTSFGKEVSDHALELASILVGLGDTFDMEDFLELRLQALIAVLVSSPAQMAPWFARQVFDGDYSLSQRTTVLSVLGLGARELAGYKDEDEDLNPNLAGTSFPSKQLPERLHKMYTAERNAPPVARIASKLERSMIQPMALDAADKMSGPNVLKVRTFSSRMEVEKKRKKVIPNALAKIVAEGFFFPLTGRWWQNLQAYGAENVHFQPFLLGTYLKTLSLILHAAGLGTISLPQMTAEFWELILSVRTNALADVSVLEAVLFATLTLLDMNEDKRRLAEEHSKQLIETQEWVELVFDKIGGGDEEGERIRMLAASVLMKTREVVDKYQRLLVGDMVDY